MDDQNNQPTGTIDVAAVVQDAMAATQPLALPSDVEKAVQQLSPQMLSEGYVLLTSGAFSTSTQYAQIVGTDPQTLTPQAFGLSAEQFAALDPKTQGEIVVVLARMISARESVEAILRTATGVPKGVSPVAGAAIAAGAAYLLYRKTKWVAAGAVAGYAIAKVKADKDLANWKIKAEGAMQDALKTLNYKDQITDAPQMAVSPSMQAKAVQAASQLTE